MKRKKGVKKNINYGTIKNIDVNGPIASRFINQHIERAINDIAYSRRGLKAKKGNLEIKFTYPIGAYARPLQSIPMGGSMLGSEECMHYREVEFTLTARIN